MTRRTFSCCMIFTILVAIQSTSLFAEEIAWNRDVSSAWKTAQTANRPLLLFVTSSHCPYCRKMESQTLSSPEVAREVQEFYVPAMVKAGDSADLAAQLKVSGVPTTFLILPDGRIADRIDGYVSAAKLQRKLESVIKLNKAR